MTDAIEQKNGYLSSFAEFEKSAESKSSSWLHDVRRDAISSFSRLGFPSTREEEWKYTNVSPIARTKFRRASYKLEGIVHADFSRFTFGEVECCQLVFIDGHYSGELSLSKALPKGACVTSLASALGSDRHLVEPNLARHASFDDNAFTALNTAFMTDGVLVYLPPGTHLKEIVHLLFLSTAREASTVSHPRNLIVVGSGSRVGIVESYAGIEGGGYFTNAVTEVVAGDNCIVDHYKLQRESKDAFHVSTLQVLLQRDSSFSSHSMAMGGALVRSDVNVVMNGEGGECVLNGLYVTRGSQHIDNHTSIDHAQPHCSSSELYKGILDDRSSAVFNGKIRVRTDAQKTNARQANKNLLLSEDSAVNTKPQLEILADDVKCTHAATIGRLDEQALFYLRSRGMDEATARTLLTYAFASDVLGMVKIKPIQCQIDLVLLTRLSRGQGGLVPAAK